MCEQTVKNPVHYALEIRKSRFLAYLYPVANREEALQIVADIRLNHPEARHVCWAFITQTGSGMNDDGEPSGTAGKPMFSVLQHNRLKNVLAVVVRYFGGIKLGAGGLVRAYSQAVSNALQMATLAQIVPYTTLQCVLAYAQENKLRYWCDTFAVSIISLEYETDLKATLSLPLGQLEQAKKALSDMLSGEVKFFSG